MKRRSLATVTLLLGLMATVMVLRAADDKTKGKEADVPPSPGTIKFAAAPAPVQKTYKDETKNAKIELLGKGKSEDGSLTFFKAIVGVGTNDYEFAVAEDGTLLEKILNRVSVEIKPEEIPAPVQKTLKEELKGGKVEGVSRVTAGKRSDFVVDAVIQKAQYEIIISEDGTLVQKVMSGDDDEKKEAEKPAKKPAK